MYKILVDNYVNIYMKYKIMLMLYIYYFRQIAHFLNEFD